MALNLSTLIDIFLIVVLFGALIATVADQTIGIAGTGNVTGATSTMTALVALVFVIVVIAGIVRFVKK